MPPEEDPKDKPKTGDGGAGGDGGTGGGAAGGGEDTTALKAALAKERARANAAEKERDGLKSSMNDAKSGEERTAQILADLKARADASDLRAMRAEVAAEKGLTAKQAARLQGDTVEALMADADELVAAFKPAEGEGGEGAAGAAGGQQQAQGRAGAGRPREALRPGATPPADQDDTAFDSKAFLAAVPRG